MELPWKKAEKIQKEKEKLENQLNEKNKENEKLENMLEAEKNRRSKLSREKQEAEEKLSKLNDKIKTLEKKTEKTTSDKNDTPVFFKTNLEHFKACLEKLSCIKSSSRELVTVYSPGKLSNHSEITSIKNSVPEKILKPLKDKEGLVFFYDEDLGVFCFKLNPFYNEKYSIGQEFDLNPLNQFINEEKIFALVSRGNTKIFQEKDGKTELLETVKDRVNRKHGKGGFSQGRFERKRDEQIQMHLDHVKNELKNRENLYLLGEKALCSELPGVYLGGFDPNNSELDSLYGVRRLKTSIL